MSFINTFYLEFCWIAILAMNEDMNEMDRQIILPSKWNIPSGDSDWADNRSFHREKDVCWHDNLRNHFVCTKGKGYKPINVVLGLVCMIYDWTFAWDYGTWCGEEHGMNMKIWTISWNSNIISLCLWWKKGLLARIWNKADVWRVLKSPVGLTVNHKGISGINIFLLLVSLSHNFSLFLSARGMLICTRLNIKSR